MKNFTLLIIVGLLFFSKGNDVKAQFASVRIKVALYDSGSLKCKPPYYQGFDVYLTSYSLKSGTIPHSKDSVEYYIEYGDGTVYKKKDLLPTDLSLSLITPIKVFFYDYKSSGTYIARVALTTLTLGATDTFKLPPVVFSDSCTTFVGKLYNDVNKNCIADVGELGLNWVPIRAINTSTGDTIMAVDWTDTAGYFDFKVPPGNYTLTPLVDRYSFSYSGVKDTLSPFCPSSGSRTISVLPLSTYTTDFAYECKPNDSFDAAIQVVSNGFVPADTSMMLIQSGFQSRSGCTGRDAIITVTLDPDLTYIGVYAGNIPSVSGKVLTYTLVSADISNFKSVILVSCAATATLGDTLCTTAYITPATGYPDPDLSNNFTNHCKLVASSFDPNMKEVSPAGKGEEGYIAQNTPLTYTIHFQNTGTASAKNVTITDTLDDDLDGSSLQIISSSHNMTVKKTGNVVSFNFKNIYLPDSGANYFGSMGMLTYGIVPKKGLLPGTEIKNCAGIYFDLNPPVITNYTLNTIEKPTNILQVNQNDLSLNVFPNPANTILNVSLNNRNGFTVNLMDLLGRTIKSQSTANEVLNINTEAMPNGMYILCVRDSNGSSLNTKVMVQH